MAKILIFAGTSEGRKLIDFFAKHNIPLTACVATEYGEQLLVKNEWVHVIPKRLDSAQMLELMKNSAFEYVIDATHPYAVEVSLNIAQACKRSGLHYVRIIRESLISSDCVYVDTYEDAAAYLNQTEGNSLLTTGSKNIEAFKFVRDYQNRLYPRILPMNEGLEKCLSLGIRAKNIICMQGPFTEELNIAMLKQIGARFMVTKDSGESGGFVEKISAAKKAGVQLIVIGRPTEETGYTLDEAFAFFREKFDLPSEIKPKSGLKFPLFIDLSGKKIVVTGAGKIALRRIESLLRFPCEITVIADKINETILLYQSEDQLTVKQRKFELNDMTDAFMVIAATDDREVNHMIGEECKKRNILHSVADRKEECDFYFPGIIEYDGGIIGICGSGEDHAKTKQTAVYLRNCIMEKENES